MDIFYFQGIQIGPNTSLLREGTPEEVAYGLMFLATQKALFMTGETLEIIAGSVCIKIGKPKRFHHE